MLIDHKIEFVDGKFDTLKGELIAVKDSKYGIVNLCVKSNMHIPVAKIKLHSKDLAVDADAIIDDAYKLAQEIARRWNEFEQNKKR
jgi:hypothetical protein